MTSEQSSIFFSLTEPSKIVFFIVCIISSLFLLDTSISYVADFLVEFNISDDGLFLFIIISVTFALGQFLIMRYLRHITSGIRLRSRFIKILHSVIMVVQYTLLANLAFLILEIFLFSGYNTSLLWYSAFVSNAASAVLLLLFAIRLFIWFTTNKNSPVILIYGFAFAVLSLSEFMIAGADTFLLTQKDPIITAVSEVRFFDFQEGTFFANLYDYYYYIDIASFILMLVATSILLYHYSTNLRKIKLTVVIALPLLSYMSGYLDALNIYDTDTNPDLFSYYIFQAFSTTSAGILFAFSVWLVVRHMGNTVVRNFMITTAYGFILFYITNSASVTVTPYPPFGLPSLSFLPLATYLILIGIYSSAVSLSQDLMLRKSIRKMTRQDANFLANIGTAEMDIEIRRLIAKFRGKIEEQENVMVEETGISTSLRSDEIEAYLKQVFAEIHKIKE